MQELHLLQWPWNHPTSRQLPWGGSISLNSLSLDNLEELCFHCCFERETWLVGLWKMETGPLQWNCPRYLGASCDLLVTLRMKKGWIGRLHSEAPTTGGWHVSSVGQSYYFVASGLFPILPYANQDTNQTRSQGFFRSWEHTFSLKHFKNENIESIWDSMEKIQNNLMSFREIPSVFDLRGLFWYFSAFVEYIAMSLILSHWRSKVKCSADLFW